jgi:hypothetical protein
MHGQILSHVGYLANAGRSGDRAGWFQGRTTYGEREQDT